MKKIFGMSPLVAVIVGIGAYRWWQGLPIIPTSLTAPLSGMGNVNAFPKPSGAGAFPHLGNVGAASPLGVTSVGLPYNQSRNRGMA